MPRRSRLSTRKSPSCATGNNDRQRERADYLEDPRHDRRRHQRGTQIVAAGEEPVSYRRRQKPDDQRPPAMAIVRSRASWRTSRTVRDPPVPAARV